jgi:hypothetical protein
MTPTQVAGKYAGIWNAFFETRKTFFEAYFGDYFGEKLSNL